MHTTKNRRRRRRRRRRRTIEKEKSCYSKKFLVSAALTPPRQHQKSSISKSDASKKEIVHKHRCRPIINLRFLPWRKLRVHKTMPSTKLLSERTN
jgi:hypothetical protein